MEPLGAFFLGTIALTSLAQAFVLVRLAWGGMRLGRRVDEMQGRLDRELRPTLDNVSRLVRNLGEVSDLAAVQARRIDDLVVGTAEKVQETTGIVTRVILVPLGHAAAALAAIKAIRKGLRIYRRVRRFV